MVLNSSRLIPGWRSRYWGIILYLSNSTCHARASSGGTTPVTGFHSTMERPDSVSRLAPPTITVTNIKAATASSQSLTARRAAEDGARLMRRTEQGSSCGHSIAGIGGADHIIVHPLLQSSKHAMSK